MNAERPVTPWLLVFDLDGTLIDSSTDLCLSVNAALAHVDVAPLAEKTIAGFIGDGAPSLVQRALAHSATGSGGRKADETKFRPAYEFFLQYYREHKLDHTRLYPGVKDALLRLQAAGDEPPLMAVLTNKPQNPSREICEALGLNPFLFANHGGDSFSSKKPDPAGLLHILKEGMGLRPGLPAGVGAARERAVVMVGDSEVDVLTARRAGVLSLGCTYGLAPDKVVAANPDLLCHSPNEWPDLLHDVGSYLPGLTTNAS